MLDRYTQSARQAIFFAKHEASSRRSQQISPEDILLGLARNRHAEDCPFRFIHEKRSDLAAALSRPWLESAAQWPHAESKPTLSSSSKHLLATAAHEARRGKSFWIDTDHLQAAVFLMGGEPALALESIGYTLESIRQFGREGRERWPPKKPTISDRLGKLTAAGWAVIGFVIGLLAINLYNLLRAR